VKPKKRCNQISWQHRSWSCSESRLYCFQFSTGMICSSSCLNTIRCLFFPFSIWVPSPSNRGFGFSTFPRFALIKIEWIGGSGSCCNFSNSYSCSWFKCGLVDPLRVRSDGCTLLFFIYISISFIWNGRTVGYHFKIIIIMVSTA
jgi:hypothetical protein